MGELKTIDLFAGVGGVRLGFEKAGFKTVFSNDFEPTCKETYDLNFTDTRLTIKDVNTIKNEELPQFDVLLGGFPCQAFSIAGKREGFDDEKGRGALFFKVADIIEARKPKAFLLENVKNLVSHDNGKTFKIILDTLESMGYHVKHQILNSMMHGNVPQNRERILIAGFINKKQFEKFNFPKEIELKTNFRDLLEKQVDGKYYYKGKPLYDKLKSDIISKDIVYQWRRKYVRANKSGVVPTLTANMGTGGHNVPIILDDNGIRKLTPKECFLMQGFPKNFKLPQLADSKLYQQAGNSVTVSVIERVAREMKRALSQ